PRKRFPFSACAALTRGKRFPRRARSGPAAGSRSRARDVFECARAQGAPRPRKGTIPPEAPARSRSVLRPGVADDGNTGGRVMPAEHPAPRPLPSRPDLDHLKQEAKHLLRAARAGEPGALAALAAVPRVAALPPANRAPGTVLADAQHAVALAHGFASW